VYEREGAGAVYEREGGAEERLGSGVDRGSGAGDGVVRVVGDGRTVITREGALSDAEGRGEVRDIEGPEDDGTVRMVGALGREGPDGAVRPTDGAEGGCVRIVGAVRSPGVRGDTPVSGRDTGGAVRPEGASGDSVRIDGAVRSPGVRGDAPVSGRDTGGAVRPEGASGDSVRIEGAVRSSGVRGDAGVASGRSVRTRARPGSVSTSVRATVPGVPARPVSVRRSASRLGRSIWVMVRTFALRPPLVDAVRTVRTPGASPVLKRSRPTPASSVRTRSDALRPDGP